MENDGRDDVIDSEWQFSLPSFFCKMVSTHILLSCYFGDSAVFKVRNEAPAI